MAELKLWFDNLSNDTQIIIYNGIAGGLTQAINILTTPDPISWETVIRGMGMLVVQTLLNVIIYKRAQLTPKDKKDLGL